MRKRLLFLENASSLEKTLPLLRKRFLFQENGFHGSRTDFTSRSNSYLNEVLDDREGLPITLSVVFLELARRLEVPRVAGIPLPGRFMVGYKPKDNSPYTLIDVFEGGKEMTMEEAVTSIGGEDRIPATAMEPALKRDILLRMIHNLLGPLRDARSLRREALPYLDLTLALLFHTKLLVGIDRAKEIQIILMSDDPIASLDNSCSLR